MPNYFGMKSLRKEFISEWPASACMDGQVTWGHNVEGGGAPRIFTFVPSWDLYGLFSQHMRWWNGAPFYIDQARTGGPGGNSIAVSEASNGASDYSPLRYGGYKLKSAKTPQGLQMKVYVFSTNDASYVWPRPLDVDGTVAGYYDIEMGVPYLPPHIEAPVIQAATNASPIVLTFAQPHGRSTGDQEGRSEARRGGCRRC